MPPTEPPTLAVIIPTLNEAGGLAGVIAHTRAAARGRAVELIVSDCRSHDGTAEVARACGVRVVEGAANRGDAMNRAAALATAAALLFVHADSRLPDGFAGKVGRALARPGVVGGAFDFQFGSHPGHHGLNRQSLRLVAFCNRFRFRITRNFFGDQGVFVRRDVFERLGGFPRVPLFEDARFCQKLRRAGRTAILSPPMKTCPRRFIARGVLRQFAADLWMINCDLLGVRPTRAWDRYNALNRSTPPAGG